MTTLARKATGPRTLAGKQRSKYNAIKYGVFSHAVLLEGESVEDLQRLRDDLGDSLQPVGAFEEMLVDELVANRWRLRRVLVAEGAEIRHAQEFREWDRERQQQAEAEEQARTTTGENPGDDAMPGVEYEEGLIWRTDNPVILDRCLDGLRQVREEFLSEGFPSQKAAKILQQIYGECGRRHLRKTLHESYREWGQTAALPEEERESEGCAMPNECKKYALEEIDAEIEQLERHQKKLLEIEARRAEVERLRQYVPDSPVYERIMRREVALQRAFDRTLAQLERLQRMRLGQPVPPPLKVEVSKN